MWAITNILKYFTLHSNEHTSNYFVGILSSGFLPAITLPTRISNTSSLIDNIFVSKQGNINCAAILENEISDHQVIAINTNLAIPKPKTRSQYTPTERNAKKNFKMILPQKEFMTNWIIGCYMQIPIQITKFLN